MRPSMFRCERAMIPVGAIPPGNRPKIREPTTQFTGALLLYGDEERQDWMKVDSRLEKPWRVFRLVTDFYPWPLKQIQVFLEYIAFS